MSGFCISKNSRIRNFKFKLLFAAVMSSIIYKYEKNMTIFFLSLGYQLFQASHLDYRRLQGKAIV